MIILIFLQLFKSHTLYNELFLLFYIIFISESLGREKKLLD
jgi:hypothetical protein